MAADHTAVQVRLAGFRYHPAIGGAEHLARRLLREIGSRLHMDVVTVVTNNRTDWLRLLVDGVRNQKERYQVDGRDVCALPRWPVPVRRRLRRLTPLYHLPRSPAPGLMGRILAPELAAAIDGGQLVHNVFMGREAFSLGLMLAAHRAGRPFLFTPLRHQRPLGWSSPAFVELYRSADRLIALTQDESRWLQAHGAPADRIRVIGVGPLSDPAASPEAARKLVGDRKIVLFIGQLHRYKGFEALLRAAHILEDRRDVSFVFVGPDIRGHARKFRNAGGNVLYLSSVDDPLRDSLLTACTVLCVPSSQESFGLVLLEAWACGKPVIGGPAAATAELIEQDVDGWVVPQNPRAIADRLTHVLDDEDLARRVGARGRLKVETRFSWPSIAKAYLDVYAELGIELPPRSPSGGGSGRGAS